MTFHPGRARKAEKNAHSSDPSIDRQYWAYVAADQLTDALDENERLRADNAGLSKAVISIQEERDLARAEFRAYHKAWEEQAIEIERLQGFETAARDLNNDLIRIAGERDELAARIQELEDAHKRSGVKYAKIINELRSSVYAKIPSLQKQWDDVLAEGKIGPDADECPDDLPPIGSPHRSWQITDERKEALDRVLNYMDYMYPKSSPYYHCALDVSVLRAMLTEAEQ